LFAEKLDLLLKIRDTEDEIDWNGRFRTPIRSQGVYPRPERVLPIRVAVGGTPQSVVRAASRGLSVALAIIGGSPARFASSSRLYLEQLERFGKPVQPIGIHSPGHVGETEDQARDELWPHYATLMNRIGRERGWSPIGRDQFEREAQHGALFVGSPETVAGRIVEAVKALGLSRFDLKYANGTMPHDRLLKSIELYGTKVAPLVREMRG